MSIRNLTQLKKLADRAIREIESPSGPKGLYEPVKYALDGSGKRLRPLLLFALAESFGVNPENYLSQGAAIEMFHNFTLLHDDIMDNASMRHGLPTVHCKWNIPTAILSGDAMMTFSDILMMRNLPENITHKVMMIFSDTAMKIYDGQQMDMDFENEKRVSIDDYIEMIMLKTGALFGCAAGIGLLLAHREPSSKTNVLFKNIVKLGYLIGVVFQLQDDFLDTYGDSKTFGKMIGGDILNDKKTWLMITALNSELKDEVKALSSNKNISGADKIREMKAIFNRLSLSEKINTEIDKNVKLAYETLDVVGADMVQGGKELIKDYIKLIIGRDK